jgi:hypothetical protein
LKRFVGVLAVITILVCAAVLVIAPVNATYVGGSITSNKTWTQAGGPYRLTSTVWIYPNVTLTIEPGAIVDLYQYGFSVSGMGTFYCRGTSDNKIILYSSYGSASLSLASSSNWTESTQSGCIVENTVLSGISLSVTLCSPKINSNYFTASSSLAVSDGSPLISNNAFDCRANCIVVIGGSPTISNNFIKSTNYGLYIYNRGSPNVFNNNITSCSTGICVSGTGNTTINRNLITANTYGIETPLSNGNATIQDNVFANNNIGISGGGNIRGNLIGNSNTGLQVTSNAINITQNSLVGNVLNLRMAVIGQLNASNNWWDSTDTAAINQTIYDYKNSTSLGNVTFLPFLSQANPDAPTLDKLSLTPAPTPTPFVTPTPLPSPSTTPWPTTISPTTPPANSPENQQTEPPQTPTPSPTPTPKPTPVPTPKINPGSPLTFGNAFLTDMLTQLDLGKIAELVLVGLGLVWMLVLAVSAVQHLFKKKDEK